MFRYTGLESLSQVGLLAHAHALVPPLFLLQEQAATLVKALAQYTITLQELEDSLLARLANAQVGEGLLVVSALQHQVTSNKGRARSF